MGSFMPRKGLTLPIASRHNTSFTEAKQVGSIAVWHGTEIKDARYFLSGTHLCFSASACGIVETNCHGLEARTSAVVLSITSDVNEVIL
jgi:hypothetical protein